MNILAMAASEPRSQLQSWSYQTQTVQPFDCIVKVLACGICHSDIHMIDNDWRISRYPLVPGHEIVGEVIETGSLATVKTGDRVGIGWQRSSCMRCDDCWRGNENLCEFSEGVITHGHGGYASHVQIDSRFCFPIPPEIPTEAAGPLLCGGATVYSALRLAGMGSGQRIGVIGIGGLGHMAVLFASRLGNDVTVFTTSPEKAEQAASLGAQEAVVCKPGERPKTRRKLDIIINTVPVGLDWKAYLNLLDSDGTLTFVGVPAEPASIPIDTLLGKRRRVTASVIAGRFVIRDMLRLAASHGVHPLIETFPLSEANRAVEKVRANAVRYRAVLIPE